MVTSPHLYRQYHTGIDPELLFPHSVEEANIPVPALGSDLLFEDGENVRVLLKADQPIYTFLLVVHGQLIHATQGYLNLHHKVTFGWLSTIHLLILYIINEEKCRH